MQMRWVISREICVDMNENDNKFYVSPTTGQLQSLALLQQRVYDRELHEDDNLSPSPSIPVNLEPIPKRPR